MQRWDLASQRIEHTACLQTVMLGESFDTGHPLPLPQHRINRSTKIKPFEGCSTTAVAPPPAEKGAQPNAAQQEHANEQASDNDLSRQGSYIPLPTQLNSLTHPPTQAQLSSADLH